MALGQDLLLSVPHVLHAGDEVHLEGSLPLLFISLLPLSDVDLATEPFVQHKAVIGYQQLKAKEAGVGHLGEVYLSSCIGELIQSCSLGVGLVNSKVLLGVAFLQSRLGA